MEEAGACRGFSVSRTISNAGDPQALRARASDEPEAAGDLRNAHQLREYAHQLRDIVNRVTPEDFRWQESHYERDSRQGRELLFLIANHEWVRATSEIVDITRSNAVDTTIKIDIDLGQITHEAFSKRTGRLWLPVIVLPPQAVRDEKRESGHPQGAVEAKKRKSGRRPRPEPDPFATVTDASGRLLAMLPTADVCHQISAAMAEIIVNMAVSRWPGPDDKRPTGTRDMRLVLSAAIYRMLRHGPLRPAAHDGRRASPSSGLGTGAEYQSSGPKTGKGSMPRIPNAKMQLGLLLNSYDRLLEQSSSNSVRPDADGSTIFLGKVSAGSLDSVREAPQFAPELVRRARVVLRAFSESVVVVVPVDRESTPTVLTVRVPTRELHEERTWRLSSPSTWALRPSGQLRLDVLLPSADADRQIRVNLPDGVSCEDPPDAQGQPAVYPRMVIEVEPPQPLADLNVLLDQLDPRRRDLDVPVQRCLADLAKARADTAHEILRQHQVCAASGSDGVPAVGNHDATVVARGKLTEFRDELAQLLAGPSVQAVALTTPKGVTDALLTRRLFHRTSVGTSSPRTVVARADMVEDFSQRGAPVKAHLDVDVTVNDAEYFSIARFSGGMSLLLMTVVLVSFIVVRVLKSNTEPSAEVMAIVLTLFSAIQAGRIARPDRSTLHGVLSAVGNWLIVASILPAVVLAVVLAFSPSGWIPVVAAGGCIVLQLVVQLAMWHGPLTPLTATGSTRPASRRLFLTDAPDYRHSEALRSDWWRSTTANALMIGRKAYAYAVWQEGASTNLNPVLKGATSTGHPANVLALLHSGTVSQAATFVVFREKPVEWTVRADARELDLDPDRLAPAESVTSTVDVFLGVHAEDKLTVAGHPLTRILGAAAHRLIVLEAQLPVPAPVARYPGRRWARVRLALRGHEDIKRLGPFLNAIQNMEAQDERRPWIVAVQAIPGGRRIVISPKSESAVSAINRLPASPTEGPPVLATEMDVLRTFREDGRANVPTWRVLAICADARSNIEGDIVRKVGKLRPQLQLAGLTYALLHGTAVVLMLGHELEARAAQDNDLEDKLRATLEPPERDYPALPRLRVLVNEWRCQDQLGRAEKDPLLQVHFRSPDRPGALLNVLESLNTTLDEELPTSEVGSWRVWHAQTQVTTGNAALTRLTVRLHTQAGNVESWNPVIYEEIERKVRTLATNAFAIDPNPDRRVDGDSYGAEDPVISVSLIRAPVRTE